MAEKEFAAARKPRADAERNRVLLISVAKAAFAEKGSGASLDEIARTAGVGAGTLYRHFPTRDALVEAVYRNEVEQLTAAAAQLAETQEPLIALREWLKLFVGYITAKHGMYELLHSIAGGASNLYSTTTPQLVQAIVGLVDRATRNGDIVLPLDPLDLLRAIAGVAGKGSGADGEQAAKALIDILIAGIRTKR